MKKVLVLSSAHPWDDERVFNKITKSLSKKYETALCAVADKEFFEVDKIKIFGLPKLPRSKRYKNYLKIIKIINKFKPDIIHFHDPDLLVLSLYFKFFLRKKVIYDVHEDYPLAFKDRRYFPEPFSTIFSIFFNLLEKTISRLLDGVVTVTEDIYLKFNCKNKEVIKNYPIYDSFLSEKDVAVDGTLNLVYIGSVSQSRGITNLILAVKSLHELDISLDIVGPAENQKYFEEIKKYEDERIRIWGRVPKKDIQGILKGSHVGFVTLLPLSRYKTSLPLKLFEYMAAKVAVVASNFELWRKIIEEADCGVLVDPTDIQDVKNAILFFYNNRDQIIKKGLNGYKAFIEKYNWAKEEEKLFQFYERIIGY
ncbi:glycosyl transferase group 1 [Caldicellulosiruptor kronotskyensis 2002]|uniref:Glycosyl transferase group 1 n=1 Tax=Caldicellulosiruptor kronotskyensis (strain DSM 18902 / VKM B-2412 / 2002) TaxID=632348 RepID=E4SC78_CALK2|nr:glycosyltransferase family 4 protein [Caldicellulosiruptor kronotskyensis]ADQ46313.1 glycosyl transferase group 1 [Caldicellulosiruptor kronotskyensis 2002]